MIPLDSVSSSVVSLGAWYVVLFFALMAVFNLLLVYSVIRYAKKGRGASRRIPERHRELTAVQATSAAPPDSDLLEHLADGLLGVNENDRIVYANRRSGSLFGFAPEELTDRNYQSLLLLPEGFSEDSATRLRSGERTVGFEHEAWGLRKDGSRFPVRVTVTPCRRDAIRALVAVRELPPHSQERPEARLAPDLDAEQLLRPAKRIRQFAQLLGRSRSLSRPDRHFVLALQKLSEDLYAPLSNARYRKQVASLQLELQPEPVLLAQWLEKQSIPYLEMAKMRGGHFSLELAEMSDLVVMIDEMVFNQVFETLLDFAIKVYQSNRITIHLTHDPVPTQEEALPVPVNDLRESVSGGQNRSVNLFFIAGPPAAGSPYLVAQDEASVEELDTEPHIETARQLVALMGGELNIEVNESFGLLFQFSLPCKSFGIDEDPAPMSPAAAEEGGGDRGNILSVTEDAEMKTWIHNSLVPEGFHVEDCAPAEAVSKIREGHRVDVVLLQRDLPSEPDFDLTYEMRQFRGEAEMPILLIRKKGDRHSDIAFFGAQGTVDFQAEEGELVRRVGELREQKQARSNSNTAV